MISSDSAWSNLFMLTHAPSAGQRPGLVPHCLIAMPSATVDEFSQSREPSAIYFKLLAAHCPVGLFKILT